MMPGILVQAINIQICSVLCLLVTHDTKTYQRNYCMYYRTFIITPFSLRSHIPMHDIVSIKHRYLLKL